MLMTLMLLPIDTLYSTVLLMQSIASMICNTKLLREELFGLPRYIFVILLAYRYFLFNPTEEKPCFYQKVLKLKCSPVRPKVILSVFPTKLWSPWMDLCGSLIAAM